MPAASAKVASPLLLVCGDDDFGVRQRARQVYQEWCEELGGMDHEVLDAAVANSGEALKVLGRLRESLQTLPFFGSAKVVWLRDCSFLGDERAATAAAVTETLVELADELKRFSWQNVRLLISAGKVDKRKTFYKAVDKIGSVESFAAWSVEDRDWANRAESWSRTQLRERRKDISEQALAELVIGVGPFPRLLTNEIEKLSLYVGDRSEIQLADVAAVCVRNKTAKAFALGDALGDRDLPRLLRRLDEELWEMQFERDRSEIGLLYGLITKVRAMLFLKEMLREGWVKEVGDYARFKSQLERLPADRFPADRRFNPLALNPYVLFKALPQARNYSRTELVQAMESLLRCNEKLISSSSDDSLVLQHALARVVGQRTTPARAPA